VVFANLLKDAGCDTLLITGGLSKSSDRFPCPVVLLEMILLREFGWGLLEAVRFRYRESEIVVVTRTATPDEIIQSVCMGIAEYVTLPVENVTSFLARLHELAAVWEERQHTSQDTFSDVMTRGVESWIRLQFHSPTKITWQQLGEKFQRRRGWLSIVLRQAGLSKRKLVNALRRDVLRIALRECCQERFKTDPFSPMEN
jgi:ActR/RegA family two-component response regulator